MEKPYVPRGERGQTFTQKDKPRRSVTRRELSTPQMYARQSKALVPVCVDREAGDACKGQGALPLAGSRASSLF